MNLPVRFGAICSADGQSVDLRVATFPEVAKDLTSPEAVKVLQEIAHDALAQVEAIERAMAERAPDGPGDPFLRAEVQA